MNNRSAILTVALLAAACMALPADGGEKTWLKGNTHTHSLWSDGNDFPEMIALWYRDHDYDFLVLSDHNVLSRGERWMKLADIEKRRAAEALPKAIARLGADGVEVRGEGPAREVRLRNLDEIRSIAQTDQFLLIEGEEITDHFERRPIHTNAFNLQELVPPPGGSSVREVMRNALLAVDSQSQRVGRPMIAHLNHPNFHYAITAEDLAHVVEEQYFEVYNGHPHVGHDGDAGHLPVEPMWDIANTIRIAELNAPPLLGVATDDSHTYHTGQNNTPGRGWIMVRAAELSAEAIIHAMNEGDFYSSTGVILSDVRFDGNTLTVEIEPQAGVEYTIEFIGTLEDYDATVIPSTDERGFAVTGKYSKDVGKVLKAVKGTRGEYKLSGKELYVRAAVRSNKTHPDPSVRNQVTEAWTQPVGWAKRIAAASR